MTYDRKKGMIPLTTDQFDDRVEFTGNLDKNDLSITLSNIQPEDTGFYFCHVLNPPDRIHGKGTIHVNVVNERKSLHFFTEWDLTKRFNLQEKFL